MPVDRRTMFQGAAAAGAGLFLGIEARAQSRAAVNLQLGWILGGNQIGEVSAKHMGFYEAEGLELRIQSAGRTSTAWRSSPPDGSRLARCLPARP